MVVPANVIVTLLVNLHRTYHISSEHTVFTSTIHKCWQWKATFVVIKKNIISLH